RQFGDAGTISMDPPLMDPCTVEIRLDGVLLNPPDGEQPTEIGDFLITHVLPEGRVRVVAKKDLPSGRFQFRKICPASAYGGPCPPIEREFAASVLGDWWVLAWAS